MVNGAITPQTLHNTKNLHDHGPAGRKAICLAEVTAAGLVRYRRFGPLGAIGAAVLRGGRVALLVDQAGAAQGLGHRAVGRGRRGVAAVGALGSAAPAVTG